MPWVLVFSPLPPSLPLSFSLALNPGSPTCSVHASPLSCTSSYVLIFIKFKQETWVLETFWRLHFFPLFSKKQANDHTVLAGLWVEVKVTHGTCLPGLWVRASGAWRWHSDSKAQVHYPLLWDGPEAQPLQSHRCAWLPFQTHTQSLRKTGLWTCKEKKEKKILKKGYLFSGMRVEIHRLSMILRHESQRTTPVVLDDCSQISMLAPQLAIGTCLFKTLLINTVLQVKRGTTGSRSLFHTTLNLGQKVVWITA